MDDKLRTKLSATALAVELQATAPKLPDEKLACFTFILEARNGYTTEGHYPNVTPEQYKIIVAALEGKFDGPRIIVAGV